MNDTSLADSITTNDNNHNPSTPLAIKDRQLPDPTTALSTPANIRLTGRMLNFTRLSIQGDDLAAILALIEKKIANQRGKKLPVLVSCQQPLDLAKLWDGLWALGLQPIGLVTGELDDQAQALRIAIFPADGQRIDGKKPQPPKIAPKPPTATTETVEPVASIAAGDNVSVDTDTRSTAEDKFATEPDYSSHVDGDRVHNPILRSGQSINHVGGDLILTHGINAGAEAITDYSLHVYGKAEGRLVAGATGDKNAKIFCVKFNPSLVSVAGTYCLKENIPTEFINQAVQVSYVDGEGLVFERMS